jgi:hypothetical protein
MMDVGMLWLDDGGQADLRSRVREAAENYRQQYGVEATLCLVNPSLLTEGGGEPLNEVAGLQLEASPTLLPKYFWIGQRERAANAAPGD